MEFNQPPESKNESQTKWATPPFGQLETIAASTTGQDSYIDITEILGRYPRRSPVRLIVESILSKTHRPNISLQPLFTALANSSSYDWRERIMAAWALGRVPLEKQEKDAASGMLVEILECSIGERLTEGLLNGLLWSFGLALPASITWIVLSGGPFEGLDWTNTFLRLFFAIGIIISAFTVPFALYKGKQLLLHNDHLRAAATETLGHLKVSECIGTLAEGLSDMSSLVRETSAFALQQILPTLTPEHYGQISSSTIYSLCDVLTHTSDAMLTFRILEALDNVGTGSALPYVADIARHGTTKHLRETAQQVVTKLKERERKEQEASSLMRPTGTPTDHLLRPAYYQAEQEVENLLRAGESPSDN